MRQRRPPRRSVPFVLHVFILTVCHVGSSVPFDLKVDLSFLKNVGEGVAAMLSPLGECCMLLHGRRDRKRRRLFIFCHRRRRRSQASTLTLTWSTRARGPR